MCVSCFFGGEFGLWEDRMGLRTGVWICVGVVFGDVFGTFAI